MKSAHEKCIYDLHFCPTWNLHANTVYQVGWPWLIIIRCLESEGRADSSSEGHLSISLAWGDDWGCNTPSLGVGWGISKLGCELGNRSNRGAPKGLRVIPLSGEAIRDWGVKGRHWGSPPNAGWPTPNGWGGNPAADCWATVCWFGWPIGGLNNLRDKAKVWNV